MEKRGEAGRRERRKERTKQGREKKGSAQIDISGYTPLPTTRKIFASLLASLFHRLFLFHIG